MKYSITALVPFLVPVVAILASCSSPSHPGRHTSEEALLAPSLGVAKSFTVLAGATVTNTGPSTVAGDIGVSPGTAVTGFPPGLQTVGSMHKADDVALQAQNDLTNAYDVLDGTPCTRDLSGTDLGGMTLTEGVYCFTSSAQLTGTLTLDGAGKADPVFIFKTVSTLTTASGASVKMINGANNCGVFWKVGSSATIAVASSFVGSIVALTSIALQTGASLDGRALARNGEVTLDNNRIAQSSCDTVADAGVSDAAPVDSGTVDAHDGGVDTGYCADPEGSCY